MNRKVRKDCVCVNCGKVFYPSKNMTGKYCSNKCQQQYRSKLKYKEFKLNLKSYAGQSNMRWVKPYILKEQDDRCAICGMKNVWNNQPIVFILDHIDGHANNNTRKNLRLICPNCDSQLPTYKSKNKNSDRVYYHDNHR